MPRTYLKRSDLNSTYRTRRDAIRGDERGEGVISLAIGVLIMAFLGAGMWVAFHSTMTTTQTKVDGQVQTIGN